MKKAIAQERRGWQGRKRRLAPRSLSGRRLAYLAAALAAACFALAHAPGAARAASCPNEAIREGQGAPTMALPECRAYELVSPDSVSWTAVTGNVPMGARAADDGDAMAYFSYYPFGGATSSGWFYRARRGDAGWSVESMSPQTLPGGANSKLICERTELQYSEDLESSLLSIGFEIKETFPEESFCLRPERELVAGEPSGFRNLFLRSEPESPYQLVNPIPGGARAANAQFQDASNDLSHVVFSEEAGLTPEAPAGYDLYEWSGGQVRLVTFLPDGSAVRGDLAGATEHELPLPGGGRKSFGGTPLGTAPFTDAVSGDGETVFFYAEGNLYVRKNAGEAPTASGRCSSLEPENACTVEVDASRGPGSSGGGMFQYASTDGGRVFFTDESRLTVGATATIGKPDLYEFDLTTNTLKDLTVVTSGAADVRAFSGASRDGSRVYFMAKGVLAGAEENSDGEVAQEGQANLYVVEEGAVTYIATLDPTSDIRAWSNELELREGDVPLPKVTAELATATSPSGRYFAFNSVRGLGGIVAGTRQIYLFDAADGTLVCASCLSDGTAPPGSSEIPAAMTATERPAPGYLPRALTDAGQLFFGTVQALLPADTDGVSDVYEYRAAKGLALLSDGAGTGASYFFDAGEGGGDVFFGTADALVQSDTDNVFNLYDARVDGGFEEAPASAAPCGAAESCRGGGAGPPAVPTAATSTATGSGNVAAPKRCRRGEISRRGHCVRPPKRHRKHRRHGTKNPKQHKKRHARGARANGAGR